MRKLKKEHEEEQQEWEVNFFKRHEKTLMDKEKEMKEKLRKERNREIEKVLMELEAEREEELEKQKTFSEQQLRFDNFFRSFLILFSQPPLSKLLIIFLTLLFSSAFSFTVFIFFLCFNNQISSAK